MIRRFQRLVLTGGLTGIIALAVWPYHDGALRYGLPLSLVAFWSAGLAYHWKRKWVRILLLAAPFLAAVPFCLPGRDIDPGELRGRYVESLRSMEGTPYLWGGESRWGIDCSGLPRRAIRDALWNAGWRTGNGKAFREWARQWWFDTSAKALGENYRGFTRPVGVGGKLRDLDFGKLSPGDLAVTVDGRHVMVHLGGGDWIQADPGPWKVSMGHPSVDRNPWFDTLVNVHRWTLLDCREP